MAAVINNPLSSNQTHIPCTNQVLLVKICYYLRKMINDGVLTSAEKKVLVGWLSFFFLVYFTTCGHTF